MRGEIKASGREKAVAVGGSKKIVGSLPEFVNKTILFEIGKPCTRIAPLARSRSENANVSLDDQFFAA